MHKKQRVFRDDKNTLPCLTYPCPILPLRDDSARTCFACLLASTWMCIYIFYLIDIKVFLLYFIFISSISLRLVKYNLICPKPASPLAFSPFRRWDGVGMGHPWSGPALSYIAIPNIKTPTHCLWQRLTVINLAPFISYLHTSYFEHGLYCCNDSLSCSH